MNILYLSWTENSASDMIETLQQLGHNVCAQLHELSFYFSDALIPSLQQVFASQSFDCILPLILYRRFPMLQRQYRFLISAGYMTARM